MTHNETRRIFKIFSGILVGFLCLTFGSSGRTVRSKSATASPARATAIDGAVNESVFDAAFRIDIQSIFITFTYHPSESYVDGDCRLYFKMRPGQHRPLFHFDPLSRGEINTFVLKLDDEEWRVPEISRQSVIDIVEFPGSTQSACEIKRDINDQKGHVIQLSYRLNLPSAYPRFSSNVDDIQGIGNEEIFPTINSPQELARHVITFRVAGSVPYRCIGSGLVARAKESDAPGVQEWLLDTEREVASYTVMFALLPEADTVYEERLIGDVPVRIMAFKYGASIPYAFSLLSPWLSKLSSRLGPFPMPRGLSVFLVSQGGGMEYFGATISQSGALKHETVHMYFGCSAIANTYRDSWWDEAIVSWLCYALEDSSNYTPIGDDYRSNIVGGRSPIAVGFDTRAYSKGAQIIENLAQKAGGREAMMGFLSTVHHKYMFSPFDSLQLCGYFRDFTGIDLRTQFVNWLYNGQTPSQEQAADDDRVLMKKIDWTPPETILRKYGLNKVVFK